MTDRANMTPDGRRPSKRPFALKSGAAWRGVGWAVRFGLVCAVLLIFALGRIEAQIGVFHNGSASSTSGRATISSFTVSGLPAVGDSYFIVGVSCFAGSSSGSCGTSITWGGSSSYSWTQIGSLVTTGNYRAVEMWQLRNPTGTGTIVVNTSNASNIATGVVLVGGVATSNPFGTFVGTHGSNNAPTAPAATTVVGDLVASAAGAYQTLCGSGSPPTGCTPGTTPPQTKQWELYSGTGSSNIAGLGSTAIATATSTTMSWSSSASNDWAIGAIPIHAAPPPARKGQVIVGRLTPIGGSAVPVMTVN